MKVGVLGLGSIGLRHARNLRILGHEVIGYDIDEKKMKEWQGKIYSRNNFISLPLDALIIATPTAEHEVDIRFCMETGRHIFVEKPIARTCGELFTLREAIGVEKLFVGYMLRFNPCVKAAKQWLDGGWIGKPLWAQFTCGQFNDKPDYLRDGVALNWSHEIDLALYLLGPAKVLTASVHLTNWQDDIADIVLEHESGARSTIHLDYVTKNEIREAWIVGEDKNIGLDMLGRRASFGKMIQEFGGDWNADYVDEMQVFISFASGALIPMKPPSLHATGEDGLRVLEICHQVRRIAGLE